MSATGLQSSVLREQHFYAATAKYAFIHATRGIVFVRDPMPLASAAKYGLSPLILYGLLPAGTALPFFLLSPTEAPLSLFGFLQDAWDNAPGLRGRPDILKVNRHIAAAAPTLAKDIAQIGVKLVVADNTDKRHPSSLRNGQDKVVETAWFLRGEASSLISLEAFNNLAASRHKQASNPERWCRAGGTSKALIERTREHLALPAQQLDRRLPFQLDWRQGDWLSSWEKSLPPPFAQKFILSNGATWLMAEQIPTDISVELDFSEDEDPDPFSEEYDFTAPVAKLLVDCWPNDVLQIASLLGTTARALKWYLTGQASLPTDVQTRLLDLLGIEYSYGDNGYNAASSCVLVAKTAKSISAVYEHLTSGGDLQFSFEAVPATGLADPSWRYLVFRAWSKPTCVIMIARGSSVAERIDRKTFMNFQGLIHVTADVYRDIVSRCGRASLRPDANLPEMSVLADRIEEYLQSLPRR